MNSRNYETIYKWIENNFDHDACRIADFMFMLCSLKDMGLVTGEEYLELNHLIKRIWRWYYDD